MARNTALIVDDVELNRDILADILGEDFTILEAGDGEAALEMLRKHIAEITVVLLDLVMPKKSGIEVLEALAQADWNTSVPVIIISGEDNVETEHRCFELGVTDFVHKPFNPRLVRARVKNAADLFMYKTSLEEKVASQTAQLRHQNERLQQMNDEIIEFVGNIVEARNMESGSHIRRVKDLTRILATCVREAHPEYGLTPHRVDVISTASAMHDVGKIMITDAVLLKPGRLTPEEKALMNTHTLKGREILENAPASWDKEVAQTSRDIAHYHHEKWDGKGYPEGLKGEEIPIEAQIVSIADCYDALVTERVYKKAFDPETAYQMILNGECGAFSPALLDCLTRVKEAFEEQARGKKA